MPTHPLLVPVRATSTVGQVVVPSCKYRPPIDVGDVLRVLMAGTRRGGGWFVVAAATLAASGGLPASAGAQSPSYQPDSPAGSEYAIPLDEARQTGSTKGGTGAQRQSSGKQTGGSGSRSAGDPALFGEGIAPAKRSSSSATEHKQPAAATTPKAKRAAPAPAVDTRSSASGISGTAVAVGTGGLVLALGAALTGAAVLTRRVPRSR
jgi:hypothetical protein